MSRPIPLPIAPVEPDIAATPVAVRIDPVAVLGDTVVPDKDIFWAVPPNTLVFRNNTRAAPLTGAVHKRRLTVPDPAEVCAYYVPNKGLIPFGISIDGNASAEETRRWPHERGQITVSVSGTVTMVAHMDDIKNINVGDRLCVADEAYEDGIVGYPGLAVPKIKTFDDTKLNEIKSEMQTASSDEERQQKAQEYRAANYFGVALELGYAEMRVLLTP